MNSRSLARRLGRALVVIVLVAIVATFVIMAVPSVIGAEHSYVVLSNSMEPSISPGDAVIVGDVAPEDVQVGDVITFRREADQPPVTHRVTEVIEADGTHRFRTKGDNNEDADPWTVGTDALIGKVWVTIPLIGHVVQFGNSPAGAAVLVGLPIALFALSELWARSGETTVTRDTPAAASTDGPDDEVLPRFEETGVRNVEADDRGGEGGGIRISPTELRLGALGFGTFALYAIYVAIQTANGVTVGVAVGAIVAAAFHVAGLATLAFDDGSGGATATDGPVPDDSNATPGGGSDD